MQFWTVEGLPEYLIGCSFKPCNAQMPSFIGKRHISFKERRQIFFPPRNQKMPATSVWDGFVRYGYIRLYHEALQDPEVDSSDLNNALDKIFKRLQCLPTSVRPSVSQAGRLWLAGQTDELTVELIVNPAYYKVDLLEHADRVGAARKQRQARTVIMAKRKVLMQRLGHKYNIEVEQPTRRRLQRKRHMQKTAVQQKKATAASRKRPRPANSESEESGQPRRRRRPLRPITPTGPEQEETDIIQEDEESEDST
jgi:hypothetical protein